MTEEKAKKIVQSCPNLYADSVKSTSAPYYFDFAVRDGWFDIVYEASLKIEALLEKMNVRERSLYSAIQVKEKFGTLRFYVDGSGGNPEMMKIISEAEGKSEKTCEKCGDPGSIRSRRWILTLCDKCNKEKGKT